MKVLQDINKKNLNLLSIKNERIRINYDLSKMRKALLELDKPCLNIPAIQIVGTNGKGSISAFLENILCLAKINIGVTTSPHLFDVTERIRINQKKISKEEFEILISSIKNKLFKYKLSPFELIIC